MGTVVTYRGAEIIFEKSLEKMESILGANGYCGYINLNMIANKDGLWPLEFTSRFGYPGFAICEALHMETWENIFQKLLYREEGREEGRGNDTIATRGGFSVGVVMTVPPFPHRHGYSALSKGMPITFSETLTASERGHLHWAEVAEVEQRLITSGMIGYLGVAIGTGNTIKAAAENAYQLTGKIVVPNLRYRNDIGKDLRQSGWSELINLGLINAELTQ
jgi:phosphoribosylamine--glycine ligase